LDGGRAGGLPALAAAVGVDALDQLVELGRRHQARAAARSAGVGADVDDADAVVRVEHGQRVGGRMPIQRLERLGRAEEQRVQHQRRQREVVHPVHRARSRSAAVVGVHLHQHLDAQRAGARGELVDEGVRSRAS
jgi:hypothetical protein